MASQSMQELSRRIMESLTRMIDILQEEIDASKSLNTEFPDPDHSFPSTEQIEAPSVNDKEPVVHGTPPLQEVQPAQMSSEITTSHERWRTIGTTAGEKKSHYSAPRLPPPKPSQSSAFTKRNGSSTETTPSLFCKIAAIPLLEPPGDQSFSEWRCPTNPLWVELRWTSSLRRCLFHARLNNPTPPPKPADRSFQKLKVDHLSISEYLSFKEVLVDGKINDNFVLELDFEPGMFRNKDSLEPLHDFLRAPTPAVLSHDDFEIKYNIFRGQMGGVSIHGQVYAFRLITCVCVQMALLDFYLKMGEVGTARQVFDEMANMIMGSSNSLFCGYRTAGILDEAQHFIAMIPWKDVISMKSMVSRYAKEGNMDQALMSTRHQDACQSSFGSDLLEIGNLDSIEDVNLLRLKRQALERALLHDSDAKEEEEEEGLLGLLKAWTWKLLLPLLSGPIPFRICCPMTMTHQRSIHLRTPILTTSVTPKKYHKFLGTSSNCFINVLLQLRKEMKRKPH